MNHGNFDQRWVHTCAQIAAEMNRAGDGVLEALESLRVVVPALAARVELL